MIESENSQKIVIFNLIIQKSNLNYSEVIFQKTIIMIMWAEKKY